MRMNLAETMAAVEAQMPARRWQHTVGVVNSAVALASRYGANPEQARIAAVLHDVAKYWPTDRQREAIETEGEPAGLDTLAYDKSLWHAHAGAFEAKRTFGVGDAAVLDAIRYHTSGRVGMSLLEKVVCLADYIEPGRDFPGVDELRALAESSLDKALIAGIDGTIQSLIHKGKRIYPLTVMARNDLLSRLEQVTTREVTE